MNDTTNQAEETGLLCVCGQSLIRRPGLSLLALAALEGWTYYPQARLLPPNALCPECKHLDGE